MASKKEIDQAISRVQKDQGEDCIISRMGEIAVDRNVEALPTGIFSLDRALGVGGFPKGRIVEIYGPNSNGKTAVLLHTIAETQRNGGQAAFVDTEATFDPIWAAALGVDVDKLVFIQGMSGESNLSAVEELAIAGIDLIGIDSVEGLVPRAEVNGEYGDSHMGLKARMMSQACRKLTGKIAASKTCIVFTNQIRMKIGVVFGNPETTPGGQALLFWSSVRVEVRRKEYIDEGDVKKVGIHVCAKIVKSKVAPPFQEAEFDIYSGVCGCHARGVDMIGDVLDAGVASNVVEKSGTWLSFNGERMGPGRARATRFLVENPEFYEAIRAALREPVLEEEEVAAE